MIDRNQKQFGDKDLALTATMIDGPNARKTFTFDSRESVKIDPGTKAATMKGMGVGPISVVAVAAEPTVEFKLSVAEESRQFLAFAGNVANRFTLNAVWSTSGKASVHYKCSPCVLGGGGGFDTSPDAPPTDTLKANTVDVLINGVSIYPKPGVN